MPRTRYDALSAAVMDRLITLNRRNGSWEEVHADWRSLYDEIENDNTFAQLHVDAAAFLLDKGWRLAMYRGEVAFAAELAGRFWEHPTVATSGSVQHDSMSAHLFQSRLWVDPAAVLDLLREALGAVGTRPRRDIAVCYVDALEDFVYRQENLAAPASTVALDAAAEIARRILGPRTIKRNPPPGLGTSYQKLRDYLSETLGPAALSPRVRG